MKIKALIITAALVVATAAPSMAQVYSANAVGYVNMTLPIGLSLIANPLDNGDNKLDTILPLPIEGEGATIFRFNASTQRYRQPIQFIFGVGWLVPPPDDADPNASVLEPGEGFFLQHIGSAALNVTFVGDVPQGNLSNPVVGGFNLSILASQVPQEAALGHTDTTIGGPVGLEFPAVEGDTVFLWNSGTQKYAAPWQFIGGLGWSDNGTDFGNGPTIPVGVAFFVQKAGPASQSWARTFSVN